MIPVEQKSDPSLPAVAETESNRFEKIRNAAAERRRKSDTDGTRRRDRQTVENNRLL